MYRIDNCAVKGTVFIEETDVNSLFTLYHTQLNDSNRSYLSAPEFVRRKQHEVHI